MVRVGVAVVGDARREHQPVVLIVDDEPAVGRSVARLVGARFRWRQVDSVAGALEALKTERFDVVLCDVVIPRQSGVELHEALCSVRPEAARRIVFMTGGTSDAVLRERLEQTGRPVLQKPFALEALFAALDSAIRG